MTPCLKNGQNRIFHRQPSRIGLLECVFGNVVDGGGSLSINANDIELPAPVIQIISGTSCIRMIDTIRKRHSCGCKILALCALEIRIGKGSQI